MIGKITLTGKGNTERKVINDIKSQMRGFIRYQDAEDYIDFENE